MDGFEESENITNSTFEEGLQPTETAYDIFWEIVIALLCISGICLNFVIIYTIFRYKKLNNVAANIFIANFCIADIFILITLRSNFRLLELLEGAALINRFVLNVYYNSQHNFRVTYMLFMLAVTFDWFLASYFSRPSQKFRKYYKFTIILVWVLNPIVLFSSLGLGVSVPKITYGLGYLAFWLLIISLFSFIRVQKCRNKSSAYPTIMLKLITYLLICWLPLWVNTGLELRMHILVWQILECCYLVTCVVTFTVLYRGDKDFRACFQQAIKYSRNRRGDEPPEFQSFPENLNSDYKCTQPNLHENGHANF